jgi:hypothetical protein
MSVGWIVVSFFSTLFTFLPLCEKSGIDMEQQCLLGLEWLK